MQIKIAMPRCRAIDMLLPCGRAILRMTSGVDVMLAAKLADFVRLYTRAPVKVVLVV